MATEIDFTKMNGCGNDFVVIDARKAELQGLKLTPPQIQTIAARTNPITEGCDQVLIIRPPKADGTAFMEIRNADGGQIEACGNGTRAIAAYLAKNDGIEIGAIETLADTLAYDASPKEGEDTLIEEVEKQTFFACVAIMMSLPKFNWQDIPLNKAINDTARVKLHDELPPAFLVNLGNPHAVFFVGDEHETLAEKYGPKLERHEIFKNGANINFARIEGHTSEEALDKYQIKLSTWERGVGLTKSCGTGACATAIACHHLFSRESVTNYIIRMAGGNLQIAYSTDNSFQALEMGGAAEFEFDGKITLNDKVEI